MTSNGVPKKSNARISSWFDGVNYTVIATGAPGTTEAGDTIHTVDFGGSDIIQITSPTTIFAGISNINLNRTYAFSIGVSVAPVPEPASAMLGLIGMGVLAMRRKRGA